MSLSQYFHMEGTGKFFRVLHRKGPQIFCTGPPKPKATTGPMTQQANLPTCSPAGNLLLNIKQGIAVNINCLSLLIGLDKEIEPRAGPTNWDADALTTVTHYGSNTTNLLHTLAENNQFVTHYVIIPPTRSKPQRTRYTLWRNTQLISWYTVWHIRWELIKYLIWSNK